MLRNNVKEIFQKICFLIENAAEYLNLTKEIQQIFENNPEDFVKAIMKKTNPELDEPLEDETTIPHKAVEKGNLEIIVKISEIYLRYNFFSGSAPQNISAIRQPILYREINLSKTRPSPINEFLSLKNGHGNPVIHRAICHKQIHIVNWLIENGADINALDHWGQTPLHCASHIDIDELFPFLLEKLHKKINLNAQDNQGYTILHIIVDKNKPILLKKLLDFGADVNHQNSYGSDALSLAAYQGNNQMVKILLKRGANLNCLNHYGNDALNIAAYKGSLRIVKLLLRHGTEKNIRLKNIKKAISMTKEASDARRNPQANEVIQILEETLKSYQIKDTTSVELTANNLFFPRSKLVLESKII